MSGTGGTSSDGLVVDDLTVCYGGLVANERVSLEVRPGQVVGLIGPNGAGKSTFVDAVSGFTDYHGTVRLGDLHLDGLAAHRRARAGLARTWQSVELFDDLSVRANVEVAGELVTPRSFLREWHCSTNPRRGWIRRNGSSSARSCGDSPPAASGCC